MNHNKLKRHFPNASETFIKLNSDNSTDSRMSDKSKSLDRKEVCETQRGQTLDEKYKLKHVAIRFFANHGRKLDQDNCAYVAKPILDALVNLEFAKDDSEITSEVTQRVDKDYTDI